MTRTVWAVQSNLKRGLDGSWAPKFDLSQAGEFGNVEFIFGHGQAALMGGAPFAAIQERLRDYEDGDYVLPIGDPVLWGMVCAYLVRRGFEIQALRWDGQTRRYDVVTI